MHQSDDKFTHEAALWFLGLSEGASENEILGVYRDRCQPLKRRLVKAQTVEEKNQHRREIRTLIRARDTALGNDRGERERLGIKWRPLLYRLDEVRVAKLDRKTALAALDLAPHASDDDVQQAFRVRYRVLTRALGNAKTDVIMAALRDARTKMRRIREFLEAAAFEVDTLHTDDLVASTDTGELGGDTLTDELEIQG